MTEAYEWLAPIPSTRSTGDTSKFLFQLSEPLLTIFRLVRIGHHPPHLLYIVEMIDRSLAICITPRSTINIGCAFGVAHIAEGQDRLNPNSQSPAISRSFSESIIGPVALPKMASPGDLLARIQFSIRDSWYKDSHLARGQDRVSHSCCNGVVPDNRNS